LDVLKSENTPLKKRRVFLELEGVSPLGHPNSTVGLLGKIPPKSAPKDFFGNKIGAFFT